MSSGTKQNESFELVPSEPVCRSAARQGETGSTGRMTRVKKFVCIIMAAVLIMLAACQKEQLEAGTTSYGVFIGIDHDNIGRLDNYDIVVVEPNEFSKKEVGELHEKGKTVYAYLNIGTVETFRSYFDDFENITLDLYGDWPDEYWIDVSNKAWQEYCLNLALKIKKKGFDGFFIDNLDVYHYYPNKGIYDGICNILRRLKTLDTEVIINGAKEFVTTTFSMGAQEDLFDAVNQEEVFTKIDFDDETYHNQSRTETAVLKNYLKEVKKEGYDVYLLEYSPSKATAEKIWRYCKKNGFKYYLAKSLMLE